jgi:hypothetical protein
VSKSRDRMHALCAEHAKTLGEPSLQAKRTYATIVLAEQVERIADALDAIIAQEKQARDFRAHQRKKAKGQL